MLELRRREPGMTVALAFLDHLAPRPAEAFAELAAAGVARVRVVAAFLSPGGGHVKRDVPAWSRAARAAHPELEIELVPGAVGAEPEVIDALVAAARRLATP
ncbi:MAG: CbiX/SirB N-terminal domain-containing protein [Nannocystaceae bacterium]